MSLLPNFVDDCWPSFKYRRKWQWTKGLDGFMSDRNIFVSMEVLQIVSWNSYQIRWISENEHFFGGLCCLQRSLVWKCHWFVFIGWKKWNNWTKAKTKIGEILRQKTNLSWSAKKFKWRKKNASKRCGGSSGIQQRLLSYTRRMFDSTPLHRIILLYIHCDSSYPIRFSTHTQHNRIHIRIPFHYMRSTRRKSESNWNSQKRNSHGR